MTLFTCRCLLIYCILHILYLSSLANPATSINSAAEMPMPMSAQSSASREYLLNPQSQQQFVRQNSQRSQRRFDENQPNPSQRIMFTMPSCIEKCSVQCQAMYSDHDVVLFICPRLKPVEKKLYDRFIEGASWPWLLFLAALGISLIFCCVCLCWNCCCRSSDIRTHADNGRDSNSSREPLSADRRIEEIINEHPSTRISGSKYVVDV